MERQKDFLIDCSQANILGEQKKKAWDPIEMRQKWMYGFFITFDNHEYGSLCMTRQQFLDQCNGVGGGCCEDGPAPGFRIHVEEFVLPFV